MFCPDSQRLNDSGCGVPVSTSSCPGCPQPHGDNLAQARGSTGGRGKFLQYTIPAQTQLWSATARSTVLRLDMPKPGEALGNLLYFSFSIIRFHGHCLHF